MTNVRAYTSKELLELAECYGGKIPNEGEKYLIIGVQSREDAFNEFDDKFYVFDGNKFKMVTSGTTNPGRNALMEFDKYGLPGAAVWRTNQFVTDCYKPGYHKGRMKALRQNEKIYFYRDANKNKIVEEYGKLYHDIIWANLHGVSYDPFSKHISTLINGWSFGCQVMNRMSDYRAVIDATWKRNKTVDYCLLKET